MLSTRGLTRVRSLRVFILMRKRIKEHVEFLKFLGTAVPAQISKSSQRLLEWKNSRGDERTCYLISFPCRMIDVGRVYILPDDLVRRRVPLESKAYLTYARYRVSEKDSPLRTCNRKNSLTTTPILLDLRPAGNMRAFEQIIFLLYARDVVRV